MEMKTYKSPSLMSYKSQDITEIMGPTQTQYMDVGGGWRAASLNSTNVEYRQEGISSEIKLAQTARQNTGGQARQTAGGQGIKTIKETIV